MSQTPNTAIAVIGIDIGKNSFHVVGHDARGAIVLTAKVLCFYDIERVIPHDLYPGLNDHYCKLLEDRCAALAEIHGDTDELTDGPANAAWDARDQFAETVPTTLPGLLAMIVYANELAEEDSDAFFFFFFFFFRWRELHPASDAGDGRGSSDREASMKQGHKPKREVHGMIITDIEAPPQGNYIWSGMAIHEDNHLQWFNRLDGSYFLVRKEAVGCRQIDENGDLWRCFMNVDDPPDGAKKAVLRAIRAARS